MSSQVHLVGVPAQLPRDARSRSTLATASPSRTLTSRRAERARQARHPPRVLARVEHSTARCSGPRRPGPPRRGAAPPTAPSAATRRRPARRRRRRRRRGARAAEEVIRIRGAARTVGAGARGARRGPRAGLAQALEQRAPPAVAQRGARRPCSPAALPALVGGARRAQLADDARLAGSQERVRLLAAQQSPLANVAGDVGLRGDDRSCASSRLSSGSDRRCPVLARLAGARPDRRYACAAARSSPACATTFCARWPGTSS